MSVLRATVPNYQHYSVWARKYCKMIIYIPLLDPSPLTYTRVQLNTYNKPVEHHPGSHWIIYGARAPALRAPALQAPAPCRLCRQPDLRACSGDEQTCGVRALCWRRAEAQTDEIFSGFAPQRTAAPPLPQIGRPLSLRSSQHGSAATSLSAFLLGSKLDAEEDHRSLKGRAQTLSLLVGDGAPFRKTRGARRIAWIRLCSYP